MRFLRYGNTLTAGAAAVALALAVSQPAFASNNQVELVPDDTLFYVGTGKPVPVEDFFSLLPSAFSPELIKAMLPELNIQGGEETTQKITDFLEDPAKFTNEWGLGDELQFSAYTIGFMPVIRIAGEAEKFEAAVAKATAESAEEFDTLTHKGIDVRIAPLEDDAMEAPTSSGPSLSSLKNTKSDLESALATQTGENTAAQTELDVANASLDAAKESNDASGIADAANQIAQSADTVAKTTLLVTETEQELARLDTLISDAEKKQLAQGKAGPGLITAAANGDLVFAMATNAYDPDVLDQILGLTKPENSLEGSGKLKDIRKEWGYGDEMAMYLDFKLLADAITGGDSLAARQIKSLEAADPGEFSQFSSEPCRSEIRQMAENWPMMVAGNRLFEVKDDIVNFDSHFAMVMQNESLRDTLKLLSGAVPASQSNSEALLSMGLGINVDTAPQLVAQLTEILSGIDYQCALLQDVNQIAEFDISTLSLGAMMFSGMARGVSGISFNLYDGELDTESPIPVKSIDSAIAIAAEDPSALVQSLRILPQLSILADIPLDGTPMSLNNLLPIPLPEGAEIFAAVKGKNIVLYSGDQSEDFANRLENAGEEGLFFTTVNTRMLIDKMTDIVGQLPEEMSQAKDLETAVDVMKAYPSGNLSYKIDFTDKGFELESSSQIDRPAK